MRPQPLQVTPAHLPAMVAVLWLAGVTTALAQQSGVSHTAGSRPPVVRGIDHFFATTPNPEPLYRFFRDTLGLPEVYPFNNYGDFSSGIVSIGNVLFEVVTWAVPAGEQLPIELKGLAFEPYGRLPETLARMAEYGVPPQKPDSVLMTRNGQRTLAYINVPLDGPGGLPPSTASIFINDNLGDPRAAARRAAGAEELERRQGGALGAVAVVELVIGVEDPDSALVQWRRLFGDSVEASGGVIRWPAGPAMRFVRAPRGAIQEMIVRVRSVERARQFLQARGMASIEAGGLYLRPAVIGGLRLRMVE